MHITLGGWKQVFKLRFTKLIKIGKVVDTILLCFFHI